MNFLKRLAKFKFSLMFVVLMAIVMPIYPEPPVMVLGFLTAVTLITLHVENKTEECK